MYDFGLSILEQYGLEAKMAYRGRGALIVETGQGQKVIKEFQGSEKKLRLQRKLQLHIKEQSDIFVDCVLENQDGEVISNDKDGISYVVRDWMVGRECDVKLQEDIFQSLQLIARLHNVMHLLGDMMYQKENLLMEYSRHNREMKSIRNYIQKKKTKTEFEQILLRCIDRFWAMGESTLKKLEQSEYQELYECSHLMGSICHGECNQHNILFAAGTPLLVNYDHWNCDCQVTDLFLFMRKILEKHHWNIKLGRDMILAYHQIKPLSLAEVRYLQIQMAYPWKFWKLINHYASSSKSWLNGRYMEKLTGILQQESAWTEFQEKCFSDMFLRQFAV